MNDLKKDITAYMNFVCPKCFHKLHECTCSLFPPWNLIFIDEMIQDHVRILNEKGYLTSGSCEGHYTGQPGANTAICFAMDFPEIIESTLPDGFKYNKGKHAVWHFYNAKLSEEKFNIEKAHMLLKLLEWCRTLPVGGFTIRE